MVVVLEAVLLYIVTEEGEIAVLSGAFLSILAYIVALYGRWAMVYACLRSRRRIWLSFPPNLFTFVLWALAMGLSFMSD